MGYDTTFTGRVTIEPPLDAAEVAFLKQFSKTDHRDGNFPGYWCQWVTSEDGTAIVWDEGEKFYDAEEWMRFIIQNFLAPGIRVTAGRTPETKSLTVLRRNHILNGVINAEGEEAGDIWKIVVKDNVVTRVDAQVVWPDGEDE
jgi:hypothetical protein